MQAGALISDFLEEDAGLRARTHMVAKALASFADEDDGLARSCGGPGRSGRAEGQVAAGAGGPRGRARRRGQLVPRSTPETPLFQK